MKNLFLLLRILTGLSVSTALVILLAIVLLRSGATFLKESVGVVGYVAQLFTSGFTKGTALRLRAAGLSQCRKGAWPFFSWR